MIRSVSKTIFAHAGDTVTVHAELRPRIDEIGNFSLETASPGKWWGTAVVQLPKETPVPKTMKTASFAGVCHLGEPKKTLTFKCEYSTWIRVVQYLTREQIPSVSATICIDTGIWKRFLRYWSSETAEQPSEREF